MKISPMIKLLVDNIIEGAAEVGEKNVAARRIEEVNKTVIKGKEENRMTDKVRELFGDVISSSSTSYPHLHT